MAKLHWPGGALTAPIPPALVTCGDFRTGEINVLTVAWTGIVCTHPPKTYISIRKKRHSYHMIEETREFTVNLPPASLVRTVDACGVYTGAKVNKFERFSLTPEEGSEVACPTIKECPLSLECRVTDILPLGSHDMFLADIVAVNVDETLVDKSGKLRLDRANLLAFAHGEYFTLGECVGSFGFSVKKKRHAGTPRPQKK